MRISLTRDEKRCKKVPALFQRAAALALALLLLSGFLPAQAAEAETCAVPILMYHEIKTFKTGTDVITPDEFECDLKYLKEHGFQTVTMSQLVRFTRGEEALPEHPVVLTFDDGYLSTYHYAFPLLKKYHMRVVLSVIGKNADDFTEHPDDDDLDYAHATWPQLKEMADSGFVELQNHTYDLHSLSRGRIGCTQRKGESDGEYARLLADDLGKLQGEILQCIGFLPNTFAYPYGKSGAYTEKLVRELGFQATLTCDYGVNLLTRDPECLFGLKRIRRGHGDRLEKLLAAAMKTIRH